MQQQLKSYITEALSKLGYPEVDFVVELPKDISNGDFSTNVALVLAKKIGKNPREVAEDIFSILSATDNPSISKIEIAGPGFINFYLSKEYFETQIVQELSNVDSDYSHKKVITEYTDPNVFKQFHIGHLMANTIGEAVSRIYELGGASVTRMCYQGDIGPHVAKSIWGMIQNKAAFPHDEDSIDDKVRFLGESYVFGAAQYAENSVAESEIKEINKKLFEKSDPELQIYYDKGREWSLEYFEIRYKMLGTKFDYYFFETQTAPIGKQMVLDNISNGIFEKSEDGEAIIYKGEKDGLHTRVFINSQGLPTYEAKDLGMAIIKSQTLDFDLSVIVTAQEQTEYFKVMLAALSKLQSKEAERTVHVSHGLMMHGGKKMSSRKGALLADDLIDGVKTKVREKMQERDLPDVDKEKIIEIVSVGAVKYSILKQAPGKNIEFDFEKSVSFEGDSGPYLQYACIRAQSLLAKAPALDLSAHNKKDTYDIEKMLIRFDSVVNRAIADLAPQLIAGYLIDLASHFNSWYAQERIIGDDNEAYKLLIVNKFVQVLRRGLFGLGIEVPERM